MARVMKRTHRKLRGKDPKLVFTAEQLKMPSTLAAKLREIRKMEKPPPKPRVPIVYDPKDCVANGTRGAKRKAALIPKGKVQKGPRASPIPTNGPSLKQKELSNSESSDDESSLSTKTGQEASERPSFTQTEERRPKPKVRWILRRPINKDKDKTQCNVHGEGIPQKNNTCPQQSAEGNRDTLCAPSVPNIVRPPPANPPENTSSDENEDKKPTLTDYISAFKTLIVKTESVSSCLSNTHGNSNPPENGSGTNVPGDPSVLPEAVNVNRTSDQPPSSGTTTTRSDGETQCDIIASTSNFSLSEPQPDVITTSNSHPQSELVSSSMDESASGGVPSKRDAATQCTLLKPTADNFNHLLFSTAELDFCNKIDTDDEHGDPVTTRDQGVSCKLISPRLQPGPDYLWTEEHLKMTNSEWLLSWFPRMGRLEAQNGAPVKVLWHDLELGWTGVKTPILLITWEGLDLPHWVKSEFMMQYHSEFIQMEDRARKRLRRKASEATAKVTSAKRQKNRQGTSSRG